jgi:lipoprotein-anchoring transpeptidase ErfK/SrfK
MNRRTALAVFLGSPFATQVFAEERFPVFASDTQDVDYRFRRREMEYDGDEAPGTIIVDPKKRFLFYVLPGKRAMRYGVGVGREGFGWSGTAVIQRKADWPKWTPTPEALIRTPRYEKWKAGFPGGPGNPLGARAMYLYQDGKDTYFRIHGTVEPKTIGTRVSTGCIRMINVDVIDLYDRVPIGTKVIVR